MSSLFPELDEVASAPALAARPDGTSETFTVAGDAATQGSSAQPRRPASSPSEMLRRALVSFDKILALPGRFVARGVGECHVQNVELLDDKRIALHMGGGPVAPTTLYIVPAGQAQRTIATTEHLALVLRGSEVAPVVTLLVGQIAFRLQKATFELLHRIAATVPHTRQSVAGGEQDPTMPGLSWPPTDLDEEYLNSLGFGYAPPGAWRNFLQGHENNYGGIENARGYCQKVAGNIVNVNHTEIECYQSSPPQHNGSAAFWNHAMKDFGAAADDQSVHLELFSDLREYDVIKGGTGKLDRMMDALARSGRRPDLVVVTSTCTTTVIGDDTVGSVEKFKRKLPVAVVNMAESRDVMKTVFDDLRASQGFLTVPRRPDTINIVGMPQLIGHRGLFDLLG
ncbi:MAG: nitrogenase component 1, partial [Deltaproteobacteria bacterium]